jgi:hypothetical protein
MRNLLPCLLTAVLATAAPLLATAPLPPSDELAQYDFEIEQLTLEELTLKTLTDYIDALSGDIRTPIHPPELPPQMVDARIEAAVKQMVEQAYPEATYEKIKQDAEEKYKMWRVGQRVEVHHMYMKKPHRRGGILEAITREKVKVEGLIIYRADIAREDLTRLYLAEHQEAKERYIRNETQDFDGRRNNFITRNRRKLEGRLYPRFGYKYLRDRKRWTPRLDFYAERFQREREQEYQRIRTEKMAQVYIANGYVFREDIGRWERIQKEVVQDAAEKAGGIFARFKKWREEKLKDAEGGGNTDDPVIDGGAEDGGGEAGEDGLLWEEDGGDGADAAQAAPPAAAAGGDDVGDIYDED